MDMPTVEEVKERYEDIWNNFASDLCTVYADIGGYIGNDSLDTRTPLHDVIKSFHWIPYTTAHQIVEVPYVDNSSNNIGSITGMFFEQLASSVIVPYIRNHLPDARIERNCCSNIEVRKVTRDPDLFIQNGTRSTVIEIKVVLTKSGIDRANRIRRQYANLNVPYFLIGGKISARLQMLHNLAEEQWASFTYCKNSGMLEEFPKIDELLASVVLHLNEA